MATNVNVEVVGGSAATLSVHEDGDVVTNDTTSGFFGTYFSAFYSDGSPYNVHITSADGLPFDIATLSVVDTGNTTDWIQIYALDVDGNPISSSLVDVHTVPTDVTQPFSAQLATLNYAGVYGIAITALNNSGGAFYFDSDAIGTIVVPPPPDVVAPMLVSSIPVDDAIGIAAGSDIVLTFDEDVFAATGNITLVNANDPSDNRVIPITDSQVVISGNTVTINPSADLKASGQYHVEIDAGALEDASGNAFAGISDPTELNFAVVADSGGGVTPPPPQPPTTVHTDENGNAVATDRAEHFIGTGEKTDFVTFPGLRSDYAITRNPDGTFTIQGPHAPDTLESIERLRFDDGVLALDVDANPGLAFRLYQAAFDRDPDPNGLGYWIERLDSGDIDSLWMSHAFILSDEFSDLYGDYRELPTDDFLTLLYQNILDRAPEDEGFAFWQQAVADGASYEWLLAVFSESQENQDNIAPAIQDGIWYA